MRTTIDLTDHDSPAGGDPLPDPSSISLEGDEVVLQLREVEVRLTLGQCFELSEAFSAWAFRDLRGTKDLNGETYPLDELYLLREVVGRMMHDGHVYKIGTPDVGAEVRGALRQIFIECDIDVEEWKCQEATIRRLKEENATLREELERAQSKQRARRTPP